MSRRRTSSPSRRQEEKLATYLLGMHYSLPELEEAWGITAKRKILSDSFLTTCAVKSQRGFAESERNS